MFINVNLNIASERYMREGPFRRSEARESVKRFHIPLGVGGLVNDLVPDWLVTEPMVDRYLSLRPPQCRVIATFDPIIEEIERAHVLGHSFSALASSVVAIERTLNDARARLHAHETPKQELWGKGPLNDWTPNINALRDWGYVQPGLAQELSAVYKIRCRYLHSGPIDTLVDDSARCVNAAFAVLTEFIGFPERLFRIGSQIECLDRSHPLFKVFYEPWLAGQTRSPDERLTSGCTCRGPQ